MANPWNDFKSENYKEYVVDPWMEFKQGEKGKNVRGKGARTSIHKAQMNLRHQEMLQGEAIVNRAKEAKDMGFKDKLLISAGRETDKLIAGAGDIKDFLVDVTGNIPNKLFGFPEAMENTISRGKHQASQDEVYQQMEDNNGAAGAIGSMLPYLVSGTFGGPAAANLATKAGTNINKATVATGRAARGATRKGVERVAEMPGIAGKIGQKAIDEIMDPLARHAMRKGNQLKELSPYRTGALPDIVGSGGLGMAEGALHYDNNIAEGGLAGLAGGVTGQLLRPLLTKAPNFRTTNEKEVIGWGQDQGMQFLPGLKTGSKKNQMFEHGLRSDKQWTDMVNQMDMNNQAIANKVALKAAGFSNEVVDDVTPQIMRGHLDDLSAQYKNLENSSVGRFEPDDFTNLHAGAAKLRGLKSTEGRQAAIAAEEILERLKSMSKVSRGSDGKFIKATFDGANYQGVRRELKSKIDAAYKRNEPAMVNALEPMLKSIDNAMDRGLKDFGGDAASFQWKDLNEQFAMTHLMMEEGMTLNGKFDAGKMANYFRSNDMSRVLTGEGGRVKTLHKLAQLDELSRGQQGSDMTGTGIRVAGSDAPQSAMRTMMDLGPYKVFGAANKAYFNMYKRGLPGQTGLLNMNQKGIWSPQLYSRALSQGTQWHPSVVESMMNGYDYAEERKNKLLEAFQGGAHP